MAREQIEVIRLLIRVMKDMIFKNLSGWWWNYVYLSGGIAKFEMKTKTVK